MYLTDATSNLIKNKPLKDRKKIGQYFTNNVIKEKLMDLLPKKENLKILEPSYGTGEFILSVQKHFKNCKITGVEIDHDIYKKSLSYLKNCTLINDDFLTWDTEEKFDYIIGNPPYFEISLSKEEKEKYKEIISGRINIYSLFIYKSIQLLKEGGYLAFVIPKTLNTGRYFVKVRDYIIKHTNIKNIIYFDSNEFEDALQGVQIIVLKKEKNTGDYIININNEDIFVNNKKDALRHYKKYNTLDDLGYEVRTGNVVWNQNKDKLTNNKSEGKLLIWADNIENGKIILKNKKEPKGQYIKTDNIIQEKCIVVNRVIGNPEEPFLNIALVEEEFLAENHVNVIFPKNPKVPIEKLLELLNSKETLSAIKYITANTQLSKTELQYKLPLKKII